MAITICPKGHYYDDGKFFRCPYCGISLDLEEDNENPAEERTVMLTPAAQESEGDDKTVMYVGREDVGDYVTGWLVCIDGAEKGRDYRIHAGFNRIGRSYQMDICIEEDLSITRDNHCSVIYDARENRFSIMPSAGTVTYLNDEILMKTEPLLAGDRIRIGQTTLEFVAFCQGERKWEENMR
ncbi:MAG: FHA domain-containing protein [Eubacteriales bacterium]|nr:FHA domain-containing protein [Eubacteriales bacterium]